MQAGEVGILQGDAANERAGPRDEVDDAVRQASLPEELHEVVVGQHRSGGRLPHHRVAHDRGGRGQVGADGREVEGRHREDKALQGPVVHPVPHMGIRDGLVPVDVFHELGVVAEEIRRLTGGIDLRLVGRLGLAQHGGGVEDVAVLGGDQAGHLVEDGGAVLPGRGLPGLLGGHGCRDGLADLGFAGLVEGGQHMPVVVGTDDPIHPSGAHFLAADDEGDVQHEVVLALQLRFQEGALRRARGIGQDGLVVGVGQAEDRVGHGCHLGRWALYRASASGKNSGDP